MSILPQQPWHVQVLAVPQFVAAGQVENRETLPSFHYQPPAGEASAGGRRCVCPGAPRHRLHVVGIFMPVIKVRSRRGE